MVQIRVVYGALYARLAGKTGECVSVGKPTIRGVVQELTRRNGRSFAEALLEREDNGLLHGVAILVNGRAADLDTVVEDGDEVALLISFEGG